MAENSGIEWTTHTFNPWRGCTKVSAGCAHCYAETLSGRNPKTLGMWGPNGTRVVASESYWREPVKWNKAAACQCGGGFRGTHSPYCPQADRPRVFCASLADVFEDWRGPMAGEQRQPALVVPRLTLQLADPIDRADRWVPDGHDAGVRDRLFRLIDDTPHLDWLLLTKRPENVEPMTPAYFPGGYIAEAGAMNQEVPRPNVWLGTSVEDRKAKSRINTLRTIPAAVRFLSVEPLLEDLGDLDLAGIHWVIVGGESGGKETRPCRVEWVRSIVEQCKRANVACFVKQLGENIVCRNDVFGGWQDDHWPDNLDPMRVEDNIHGFREEYQGADVRVRLIDRKGGDPLEWPPDLRVRQFPEPTAARPSIIDSHDNPIIDGRCDNY